MTQSAAKVAWTPCAVWAILLSASAATIDITEDFDGADPLRGWSRDSSSLSRIVADEDGSFLRVIEESSPLNLAFSYGGALPLDGDVIFDARVRFTPAKSLSVPSLPADSKFALWQYADGSATNFYVTAGGDPVVNARCTRVNYRLDVEPTAHDESDWRRVTVRAVKDIRPKMLGFVVFVDGRLASCTDDDYLQKLPAVGELSPLAEYLVSRKALFPSIVSDRLQGVGDTLELVGFQGVGAVDDMSVQDAVRSPAAFAELGTIFELKWGRGITGFTVRLDDEAEGRFIDAVDYGEDRRLFVSVGDAATVTVTNIAYDASAGYSGPLGRVFTVPSARATLKVEQANYEVGGESFTTLAQAYSAVPGGGAIRLLRDVSEEGADTLIVSKPFTLDLAGRVLEIGTNGKALFLINTAGMSLVSSSPGGEVVVGPTSLSLFVFTVPLGDAVVPQAEIGAHEGDEGVAVKGRLVAYTTSNISIVGGGFTDASARDFTAPGAICTSVTNAAGLYVVPESTSLGAKMSRALAAAVVSDIANGSEGTITMDAVPGLYYGVACGPDPHGMSVGEWTLAESDIVTLDLPSADPDWRSVFYRVSVRP